jgi:hypothetical protein
MARDLVPPTPGSRYIPYTPDNGTWHDAAGGAALARLPRPEAPGWTPGMTPGMALEDVWI